MAHILDVASRVSHLGENYEITGLLHDAIEDASKHPNGRGF
jgi:(p)ppGpp synthase/HD superfamily hydrolase